MGAEKPKKQNKPSAKKRENEIIPKQLTEKKVTVAVPSGPPSGSPSGKKKQKKDKYNVEKIKSLEFSFQKVSQENLLVQQLKEELQRANKALTKSESEGKKLVISEERAKVREQYNKDKNVELSHEISFLKKSLKKTERKEERLSVQVESLKEQLEAATARCKTQEMKLASSEKETKRLNKVIEELKVKLSKSKEAELQKRLEIEQERTRQSINANESKEAQEFAKILAKEKLAQDKFAMAQYSKDQDFSRKEALSKAKMNAYSRKIKGIERSNSQYFETNTFDSSEGKGHLNRVS